MPELFSNRIIGVIAPKGSGKTHNVAAYISEMPRVCVFDLVHESGYLNDRAMIFDGQLRAFGESLLADNFFSLYRPQVFNIDNDRIECPSFEHIVRLCYLRGNMTLVIDEAHLLCNARSCPPMLATANLIGRHRNLNIIYVAQSFSAVARPLTRNTDEFWFFRIIEPADLDGIRERCGPEIEDRVTQLEKLDVQDGQVKPGQILRWDIWQGAQGDHHNNNDTFSEDFS